MVMVNNNLIFLPLSCRGKAGSHVSSKIYITLITKLDWVRPKSLIKSANRIWVVKKPQNTPQLLMP